MKMKIRLIVFTMVLTLFPAVCLAGDGDVVVIANPSVHETTLSKKDVGDIFLGKKTSWDDGSKIKFVVLTGATHEIFLKSYVNKTEAQFNTFWKKQVFTGKGSPPKELDSNRAMVEFVAQTAGAIGYVSANADVSKVKTITIK
jgi:ABC-type phosphate transport system substrate-binding protein